MLSLVLSLDYPDRSPAWHFSDLGCSANIKYLAISWNSCANSKLLQICSGDIRGIRCQLVDIWLRAAAGRSDKTAHTERS